MTDFNQIDAPNTIQLLPDKTIKPTNTRVRLDFLDGIRGLCAMYIVLYHVTQQFPLPERVALNLPIRITILFTQYGYYAVPIFIVLSGFCLMLPVARSTNGALRGGMGEYLRRRARRILPPYYIALAIFMFLPFLTRPLQHVAGAVWNDNLGVQSVNSLSILTHLLLVQNLRLDCSGKIDPPMWSVATEWQIYFIFPFLLLPVWRRWGNWPVLAVAFTVGLGLHYLLHGFADVAASWFIGLFALGLVGAVFSFSARPSDVATGKAIPWKITGLIFLLAWLVCIGLHINLEHYRWVGDTLIGSAVTCLIVYYARMLVQGMHPPFPWGLRILSSHWATTLGAFSYSLYLIHFPILYSADLILRKLHVSHSIRYSVLLCLAVPVCVLLSYIFHLAFERRFMSEFAKPKG